MKIGLKCLLPASWAAVLAAVGACGMCGVADGAEFSPARVTLCGRPAPPASMPVCGLSVTAAEDGPQLAWMPTAGRCLVCLQRGEQVQVTVQVSELPRPAVLSVEARLLSGRSAQVALSAGPATRQVTLSADRPARLEVAAEPTDRTVTVRLTTASSAGYAAVLWQRLVLTAGGHSMPIPLSVPHGDPQRAGGGPTTTLPHLRPAIEQALIEWDWRMQDGIGTEREPATYRSAVELTLRRGDRLLQYLSSQGAVGRQLAARWHALHERYRDLAARADVSQDQWERLWLAVHRLRRRLALANPLVAQCGPVLFVKQAPGSFSHELTQYLGRFARPGGGLFVLEAPGRSMHCRALTAGQLPLGSYQHPDVSYDGERVLFSFCATDTVPPKGIDGNRGRHYHLYEIAAAGTGLRQLTDGPYDDFSPHYLPDGRIVFISTRRGGWHRCGGSPGHGCENYTLAVANADGSDPHPISYHETQEWDPSVLADGRIIYTRWDYVDRHAVYYEQLWTVRPDGTLPTAYFGNNTFNPVGIFEARQVPGSTKVMATAGAHHAMTAGSIILVDVTRGVDGPGPITRLTPDSPFPESETRVPPRGWHAPAGLTGPPPTPVQARRWPGHCYKSPYPLSEQFFLAAYSFNSLVGEPDPNPVNMFGIYLVDCFGNKELLYRDMNLSSVWPTPLRARPRPPVVVSDRAYAVRQSAPLEPASGAGGHIVGGSRCEPHRTASAKPASGAPATGRRRASAPGSPPLQRPRAARTGRTVAAGTGPTEAEGTFIVQDVYQSDPPLPPHSVKRLRIVQVLPKSTPGINWPSVGLPNASPGKQVLGTVPVEPDGSAHFRAPAGIPLSFQALDELGRAVQIMRSVVYLQPGEVMACTGCHEPRRAAPPLGRRPLALGRPPSGLRPAPDGSRPLSYPILVQPVLDRHCIRCHRPGKAEGNVVLTGQPQGHYTVSYNALAPRVTFSAWGGRPGDFRRVNSEPLSRPRFFGAYSSKVMDLVLGEHYGVKLDREEIERLATWMDANALFYGTFNHTDQARQQRGERIAGPDLQ